MSTKADTVICQWKINFNSKTDSGVSKEGVFAKASEISPLRVAMKEATLVVNIEMYKVSKGH